MTDNPCNTVLCWKGKDISTMSRNELEKALRDLSYLHQKTISGCVESFSDYAVSNFIRDSFRMRSE